MSDSSSDKLPAVAVKNTRHECCLGWDAIAAKLRETIAKRRTEKPILVVDCFPGVDEWALLNALKSRLALKLTIFAPDAYHAEPNIEKIIAPFLGKELPALGGSRRLSLVNLFDAEPLWRFRRTIDELKSGLVLVVGCGASLVAWGDVFVYANLSRPEARRRFGQLEAGKPVLEKSIPEKLKGRSAFLVDSGVADRWKRPLIKRWDYLLDTHNPNEPKLADGADVRRGLEALAKRPFQVPLQPDNSNGAAQKFEESSLLFNFHEQRIEMPAIDLIFNQAHAFLGETVYIRFGNKFPIRLDFSDKIANSNRRDEQPISHERSGIEIRRHRSSKTTMHDTDGCVNVLKLVEGEEAIMESPDGSFESLIVRKAKTFIVPAAVRRYNIRPHGTSAGTEISTIKALVRI